MRRMVVVAGTAAALTGIVAYAPRSRGATWGEWLKKAAWAWAGVPSGAPGWISSNWTMPRLHGPIYPVMARELDLRPDDELLEVACGSGIFLANHASHVRHVAGLDLSDIQVGLARRRLADRIAAGTAEIVKGDATVLPWADGRFSVVTCMGSVEAFPDPGRALAEMSRVLRPGGRAVVAIGAKVAEGTETHQVMEAVWVWNEADVQRMTEDAGFADVTISYSDAVGDSRLAKRLVGLVGLKDMRIVRGIKPRSVAPDDSLTSAAPALVGSTAG